MSHPAPVPLDRPLRLGIACYPTFGGSGVIATEIGLAMAARGHQVHFVCYDTPRRFTQRDGVSFHGVEVRDYALFHHSTYALALASKLVEVSRWEGLDLIHVHYAVPHATSALLAKDILGAAAPKVVTTLHGTDVTLIGTDPSYLPITRYSIERSDAVTVPSAFLREETRIRVDLPELPIEVIPNFVDTDRFQPPDARDPGRMRRLFASSGGDAECLSNGAPTLIHVSNFRPVKRIDDVISVFAAVNARHPCRLVLIGDGPERSLAEARVRALGLHARVRFLGKLEDFVCILQHCDVFLLPSESESFGVAALEAMSVGVPVVASRVGGLPEVVVHGETGFLEPLGDVEAMAAATLSIIGDPERRDVMGRAARQRALTHYRLGPMTARYEDCYRRVLGQAGGTRRTDA